MSMQAYYTTKEMTERFRVETKTLRRWRKRKRNPLPAFRFGRDYRYGVADVDRWEEGLRVLVVEETT
jgi:excisionase family DNA binding protein